MHQLPVLLFAAPKHAETELAGHGRDPAAFPAAAAGRPSNTMILVFITYQVNRR
jgi:hypothetical protein